MHNLTEVGQQIVNGISVRYNLSQDAVVHMLIAVNNGGGTMAQFNCPELGGGGQWMAGGMTMVGDMFNYGLKNTVDNLCAELSNALANNMVLKPIKHAHGGANWWPSDLGQPISSGGQNDSRYAVFPNYLAVENNGKLSVYNTLDHNISGVSQQQGSNDSLVFNSQYGTISVSSLPLVSGEDNSNNQTASNQNFMLPDVNHSSDPLVPQNNDAAPQVVTPQDNQTHAQANTQSSPQSNTQVNQSAQNNQNSDDIFQLIEKLANLKGIGAITEDEYQAKKQELLSRI